MVIMTSDEKPNSFAANESSSVAVGPLLQDAFSESVAIMARLRAPGGCPWDREQTFESIRRYTLEETYEVLDAIENKDWDGLKDELGDLLLQVLFYAEMAAEAGHFTLREVLENLNAKLIRRHPHVFGDTDASTSDAVLANWEKIKEKERAARPSGPQNSLLDLVPRSLPALMEAAKLGDKAASVGFDWSRSEEVMEKLEEEMGELRGIMDDDANLIAGAPARRQEELGDVLFTAVNLGRKFGLQAELVLRDANGKFRRRFQQMEILAGTDDLRSFSPDRLEGLWNEVKRLERKDLNS